MHREIKEIDGYCSTVNLGDITDSGAVVAVDAAQQQQLSLVYAGEETFDSRFSLAKQHIKIMCAHAQPSETASTLTDSEKSVLQRFQDEACQDPLLQGIGAQHSAVAEGFCKFGESASQQSLIALSWSPPVSSILQAQL